MIMVPIFLIFCFLFPQRISCFQNQTDSLSLMAFKSAIDLDPQGSLNSWNETLHFCSWNGIRCSRRHRDRVIAINLTSQGLMGSLSPHIGNISFLRTIILQNNTFHGQIPREISFLRRLEFVDFSNNSLTGPIPRNLSQCSNLVSLNLIKNKLSGTIRSDLTLLHKLEFLLLSANQLSGPLPPSIGNLTDLKKLSLASCKFNGEIPESIARLQSLIFLQLADNSFTGTVPNGIFNISNLESLAVDTNELEGAIPSNIGLTLPNLRYLFLAQNKFNGSVPITLSNFSYMQYLVLSLNSFTGKMPKVGGLFHLVDFLISYNLIQDDASFISSLTNCTELKRMDIGVNLLSGSLPDSIANLSTHFTDLFMNQNDIHGNIPSGIGNLVSLTSLALADNNFDGPIPVSIAELYNLRKVDARRNRFTGTLPSSLGNLTLKLLYLDNNNFSGNLPSSLGNCTNLLDLDLSSNNFEGLIPREIMSLSSVSIAFNLSYNRLEGLIPYEVGSLTNLATLDLSNNKLYGQIPNSLSRCESLQQLYLDGNLLEGEIPSEMSALMGLQILDLSLNNLSGPIPSFLEKLNLTKLNLSFNRLEGEVPIAGVFMNITSISLDGNKQLCGGIRELKLPPCPPVKSRKKNSTTSLKILIPVLVAGSIGLAILAFSAINYKRRNQTSSVPSIGVQFMRLSYADLLKATGGFSESNMLGSGRFGSVYMGILSDEQTIVAVKVLNLVVRGASKSFEAECNALRGIRHRSLVKILSVCESIDFQGNDFKALVYELKANGSLERWLHNTRGDEEEGETSEEMKNLSMIQRLNIAIDIAEAIEYLHFGTDSAVVHGDLKPSNILLDHEMNACVGDFGLAKIISDIVPSHESSSSIGIRGTIGYIPPEYGVSQSASTQGDVYSYGIILLEMFTNKRPTDDSFEDRVNLHSFVRAAMPDRVMEIVDPAIQAESSIRHDKMKDCLDSILCIGVSCSKEMPRERISMIDVVNKLHKIHKLCS